MRSSRLAAALLTASAGACAVWAPRASAPLASAGAPLTVLDASEALSVLPTDATADGGSITSEETRDAPSSTTGSQPSPSAGGEVAADAGPASTVACNEQGPQDFLVRANFLKAGQEGLRHAIQYRTDTYGYFSGFGRGAPGAPPPSSYAISTTFMGLTVKMHRKVVPALQCVEEDIKRACADHPYTPHALAGIRFRNTYRGGEVTNHIYGIAIDIDPAMNTCCGCVKPWNDAPACKRPAKTEYDRMAMPECWVHAFERYGFYWLGHDVLRDTMHFEFLGDPDRISKNSAQ